MFFDHIIYLFVVLFPQNTFCLSPSDIDWCQSSLMCQQIQNDACNGCSAFINCEIEVNIMDSKFREDVVEVHNTLRNKVAEGTDDRIPEEYKKAANMQAVSYDETLEFLAQCWLRKCKFEHTPCQKIPGENGAVTETGQNLYKSNECTKENMIEGIKYWYESEIDKINEINKQVYKKYEFASDYSHYTQMIWAETDRVGCSVSKNTLDNTCILACNYAPAGNFLGQPVYVQGISNCPKNIKNNKYPSLCGNNNTIAIPNGTNETEEKDKKTKKTTITDDLQKNLKDKNKNKINKGKPQQPKTKNTKIKDYNSKNLSVPKIETSNENNYIKEKTRNEKNKISEESSNEVGNSETDQNISNNSSNEREEENAEENKKSIPDDSNEQIPSTDADDQNELRISDVPLLVDEVNEKDRNKDNNPFLPEMDNLPWTKKEGKQDGHKDRPPSLPDIDDLPWIKKDNRNLVKVENKNLYKIADLPWIDRENYLGMNKPPTNDLPWTQENLNQLHKKNEDKHIQSIINDLPWLRNRSVKQDDITLKEITDLPWMI